MTACSVRDGFACFDGTEIWNICRTLEYVDTLFPQRGYSLTVRKDGDEFCCGCCDEAYSDPITDEPPWYDPIFAESAEFFGIIPTEINGLSINPTVRASTPTYSGGVLGRRGESARTIEVTALAFGSTCEGVEYGLGWLNATLEREGGAQGFVWQNCCPDNESGSDESPGINVAETGRAIPCVGLTEGIEAIAFEPETLEGLVYEVTFTLVAERSWIYDPPVTLFNEVVWPGGPQMNCVDYTPECIDGAAIEVYVERKSNTGSGQITILANQAKYLSADDLDIPNARYGAVIQVRPGDSILLDPRCLGIWQVGVTGSVRRPQPNVAPTYKAVGLYPVANYGETWRVCVDVPDNGSGPVSVTIIAHPRRRI